MTDYVSEGRFLWCKECKCRTPHELVKTTFDERYECMKCRVKEDGVS